MTTARGRMATIPTDANGQYCADDVLRFAENEVKLERARIVAWLRGAPDRMAAQDSIPGITSIGPLYDAGQLAACKETADCIEQDKDHSP